MKDQEREAKGAREFQGQYSHFTVLMKMETSDRLVIEVEDSISLNRWRRVIDGKFIQTQEDLFYRTYFTEPEAIFDYISENFSEVSFKQDMFNFIYSYGASKSKKTKIMTIPLEKKETNPTDLAHVRIDKMKQEFADKLTQRDTKIKSLEENIGEMKDILSLRMAKIQENNIKLQETCRMVHQRLEREEERSKRLQERLEKEQQLRRMLQERVLLIQKAQKEANASTARQVQVLRKRQIQGESSINLKEIGHHLANPHSQYYTLTNCTATSARLERAGGGNGCYNFVNISEVLPKQHNKYIIRIVKATGSDLMIGFCTEKGLGVKDNYSKDESVYYICYDNGRLYKNGSSKNLPAGCGSVEGDLVECVLDLVEWRVRWSKGGKVLAECAVPASMKGKPIYFSILQHAEGDAVEVSSA